MTHGSVADVRSQYQLARGDGRGFDASLGRPMTAMGTSSKSTTRSPATYLPIAGMVLAGLGAFLLIAVPTAFLTQGGSDQDAMVLLTAIVSVVAVASLRTRKLSWYAFTFGLISAWALGWLWVWSESGSRSLSPAEIRQATAQILATGAPAYYLGPDASGQSLSELYPDGRQIHAFYGDYQCNDGCDSPPSKVELIHGRSGAAKSAANAWRRNWVCRRSWAPCDSSPGRR
jgi:hypothetical protein